MPEESRRKLTDGQLAWVAVDGKPPQFYSYGVAAIRSRYRLWHRQPKPHLATLPYIDSIFSMDNTEGNYARTDYPPGVLFQGGFPQLGNHEQWLSFCNSELSASHLSEAAKMKVLDKVSESHWDMPVWAAELGETTSMIAETAKKLAKAGSQLKRKQFKKCAETLGLSMKSLSGPKDNWMSYRYGWIPTINDCMDAADNFAATVNAQPDVQRFYAGRQLSKTFNTGHFWFGGPQHAHVTVGDVSARSAAWLLLKRKYPTAIALESFGLVNWPANAYNLVPLSWVLDWVYPIGDYLQAQTTLLGYEVLDGGVSDLRSIKGHTTTIPNWNESGTLHGGDFEGRSYERKTWTGGMSLFPPVPDLNMNWKRCFDAASLIHNVFGPIVKR